MAQTIELADGTEIRIGDVFVASWGYDQTNIDFYEVVGFTASGKSVRVVPAPKRVVGTNGYSNTVVPVLGNPQNLTPTTKRIQVSGYQGTLSVSLKMTSYAWAYLMRDPMEGASETAFGFGH